MAADLDDVGVGLCDAARDDADAGLGDELDAHARVGVDLVQVVDELREVFDRVDVVVRRRRDERHARLGAPQVGDVRRHLLAGQLAALAGLGALRDLLFVVCLGCVWGGWGGVCGGGCFRVVCLGWLGLGRAAVGSES